MWQNTVYASLTQEETRKIEMIQKTRLRVILGEMYVSYTAALEMCGLQTLAERRQQRCLDFALKCAQHPKMERLYKSLP